MLSIFPALRSLPMLTVSIFCFLSGTPTLSQPLPDTSSEITKSRKSLETVRPAQILEVEDLTAKQLREIMALNKKMHQCILPLKEALMQANSQVKGNQNEGADTSQRGQLGSAILSGLIDGGSGKPTKYKNGEAGIKIAESNSTSLQAKSARSSIVRRIKTIRRESQEAMLKVLTAAQRKRLLQMSTPSSTDVKSIAP